MPKQRSCQGPQTPIDGHQLSICVPFHDLGQKQTNYDLTRLTYAESTKLVVLPRNQCLLQTLSSNMERGKVLS